MRESLSDYQEAPARRYRFLQRDPFSEMSCHSGGTRCVSVLLPKRRTHQRKECETSLHVRHTKGRCLPPQSCVFASFSTLLDFNRPWPLTKEKSPPLAFIFLCPGLRTKQRPMWRAKQKTKTKTKKLNSGRRHRRRGMWGATWSRSSRGRTVTPPSGAAALWGCGGTCSCPGLKQRSALLPKETA